MPGPTGRAGHGRRRSAAGPARSQRCWPTGTRWRCCSTRRKSASEPRTAPASSRSRSRRSGAGGGSVRQRWSSGRAESGGCTTGCGIATPVTGGLSNDSRREESGGEFGRDFAGDRGGARNHHPSGPPDRPVTSPSPDTRPLHVPAYRRLFLGQVATVIGAALTAVAVQQQIYDITGSSAWVGIASLVALVPLVVFGLIGGAIADTYDRRILLMITSVGIALTSIGLWATALISTSSVWPV